MSRKMAGEASAEELEELEQLLRQRPDALFTMEVISSIWQPQQQGSSDADAAFHQRWGLLQEEPPRQRRLWPRLAAAAAVLLLAGSFAWWQWGRELRKEAVVQKSEISTRNGSRSRIKLPDGTLVLLNSGSSLVYDDEMNKQKVRQVEVIGEAYFDVAKDPERPFVIRTEKLHIHVLGTTFNVRAYPEDRYAEATLIRGSIEVILPEQSNRKILLQPKQKLTVFNKAREGKPATPELFTVAALEPIPVADTMVFAETGWVENRLTFRNERFEELAQKMERWYNVKFEFEKPALKEFRLTGALAGESMEQALKAMQLIHSFHYRLTRNSVIIY